MQHGEREKENCKRVPKRSNKQREGPDMETGSSR